MILKTYQKYLIKEFLSFVLKVTFVFFVLGFIMGVLEELRFFQILKLNIIFLYFWFY